MKIILSRKGFDSQYGGQPSPILPDGTLLSLPIPLPGELIRYDELRYQDKTYLEMIRSLNPRSSKIHAATTLHLDPDLRKDIYPNRLPGWKPMFGQCDAAQGALRNSGIGVNDLFLFFGWFKQTEWVNGLLQYKKGSPDLHVIYGYLQVGAVYTYSTPLPAFAALHPHAAPAYQQIKSNCIYVAGDTLSFNHKLPGAQTLAYHPGLVLTKEGMSRSRWQLPHFFKNVRMTYHNHNSFKENYFQSRAKGQEFIIEENEAVLEWVKGLIEGN